MTLTITLSKVALAKLRNAKMAHVVVSITAYNPAGLKRTTRRSMSLWLVGNGAGRVASSSRASTVDLVSGHT